MSLGVDERVHIYRLTFGQSIMFLYDGTWCQLYHGKLHSVPATMLIVAMISIRTLSVLKTHSFYG